MDRRNLCKIGLAGIGSMVFSRPVGAMESFIKASEKKKWALVYHSVCGSTKDAATWINEGLGDIADVVEFKTTLKATDYEYFVFGGCIQAGKINTSLSSFVKNNKDSLKSKIRGLFVVCGNMGNDFPLVDTDHENYCKKNLVEPAGVTDKPSKVFIGRAKNDCSASKAIVSMVGKEFDYLKKEDCVAFGQQVLTTSLRTDHSTLPRRFELHQNSPNPFNPVTTISYSLPAAGNVLLTVSALNGRKIATLVSGRQEAGNYKVIWDGSHLAPGYYLYQLEAGGFKETRTARRVSH